MKWFNASQKLPPRGEDWGDSEDVLVWWNDEECPMIGYAVLGWQKGHEEIDRDAVKWYVRDDCGEWLEIDVQFWARLPEPPR